MTGNHVFSFGASDVADNAEPDSSVYMRRCDTVSISDGNVMKLWRIDRTGQRSGRLTATGHFYIKAYKTRYGAMVLMPVRMVSCVCDCGKIHAVKSDHFGTIKSCGCLKIGSRKRDKVQ